ncbi:pyridoxal-phosphate dependent enzyme [Jannaschia ovalis]|uniref:Pyridoxal-phosphate dependent enzyme n=1 Tax=Jannaschia ovalis TaxID=3038773 RepID=A0ABY8L6Z8_9RHOB|nr:pyridoxal-phosphate dependent enzyme [Jannaschia sp. GRR-S6-38]WGH77152.1 pyridoxal-phosphate dependent enzyme [Jannaschia sp. GRR-S6-38]
MTRLLDPDRPLGLLAQCPAHRATPLRRADGLMLKADSDRMGLGAFKALGGVYAVAALLGGDLAALASGRAGRGRVFTCASAGNHGLSVAAGARLFGAAARVHLSATVSEGFADRLRAKGAEVVRSGADYEASVAAAIADAEASGATHLADGSWPGYTEPPRLVMEGYTVIARELREQIGPAGDWPARVYLQAGVGGLAAAMAETIRADWPVQPEIVVVEPEAAACLAASAAAGRSVTVAGPVSEMGRLDCKAPSMLAVEMLARAGVGYATVSDAEARAAAGDAGALGLPTTASGAAGLAAARRDGAAGALVLITEGPA